MVQIKIKGINNQYHVYASYEDAEEFFQMLKERLNQCLGIHTRCFEAFFHVSFQSEGDVIRFFHLCEECNTLVLGVNGVREEKKLEVSEGNLRGAMETHYEKSTVLLGNIHSNSYVTSEESLYVIGSVQGSIDLLHKDCILCASSLHAFVRIGDSAFQNMTYFSPCKVYYENRKLVIEKYKEELQWEKL